MQPTSVKKISSESVNGTKILTRGYTKLLKSFSIINILESQCVGLEKSEPCIFPFTDINGKTHDLCTMEDPKDADEVFQNKPWCKVGQEGTTLVYDYCDMTKCKSKTISNILHVNISSERRVRHRDGYKV